MLVVLAISTFVVIAVFGLLNNARSSFFNQDAAIDLRNGMRNAAERMSLEMRQTGHQATVAQFAILAGQGTGGSDIIRFSIPILCSATSTLLDGNGNPAYWGAPLTWGCDAHTCMDANASCAALEYKYVQYAINASNQLERKVLDGALATVNNSTTIIGQHITNMTASVNGFIITLTLTGQKTSAANRVISAVYTNKFLLNNTGG